MNYNECELIVKFVLLTAKEYYLCVILQMQKATKCKESHTTILVPEYGCFVQIFRQVIGVVVVLNI